MDEKSMIDELVKMLDAGMGQGVGHVNVDAAADAVTTVQTMGCPDCSTNPMACSVPTLQEGLDTKE